jgi:ubiquinone/menaquinone biosynthesis C-methylase UbiE
VEAKRAVRRRFDRWGPRYERDRRSRFNVRPQREGLAALSLGPGDRFLDVGCGSGAAVREAAALAERAVGVDIAPAMIERARELAGGLPNLELVVGDSEALPFGDGAFTSLLCSSSFHHYPDPGRALSELRRVLVPGGRLALAEPTADIFLARLADRLLRRLDRSHVRLYPSAELVRLVRSAGFAAIDVRAGGERGYAIVVARAPG